MQLLMNLRSELVDDRRVLRNIGGNLNDIARQANTDGTVAESTDRVLALVGRAVERIDDTLADVRDAISQARQARLGGTP